MSAAKLQSDIVFLIEQIISKELELNTPLQQTVIRLILANLTVELRKCIQTLFRKYRIPEDLGIETDSEISPLNKLNTAYIESPSSKPSYSDIRPPSSRDSKSRFSCLEVIDLTDECVTPPAKKPHISPPDQTALTAVSLFKSQDSENKTTAVTTEKESEPSAKLNDVTPEKDAPLGESECISVTQESEKAEKITVEMAIEPVQNGECNGTANPISSLQSTEEDKKKQGSDLEEIAMEKDQKVDKKMPSSDLEEIPCANGSKNEVDIINEKSTPKPLSAAETLNDKLDCISCKDCRESADVRYHAGLFSKTELDSWYQAKYSIQNPCIHFQTRRKKDDEKYRAKNINLRQDEKDENKQAFRSALTTLRKRHEETMSNATIDLDNSCGKLAYTQFHPNEVRFDDLDTYLKVYGWWRVFVQQNEVAKEMHAGDIESLLKSCNMISW